MLCRGCARVQFLLLDVVVLRASRIGGVRIIAVCFDIYYIEKKILVSIPHLVLRPGHDGMSPSSCEPFREYSTCDRKSSPKSLGATANKEGVPSLSLSITVGAGRMLIHIRP
jgi:hypothetical protein